MPIRVFPPHYQLVYINFDISSFSLISYILGGTRLHATWNTITDKLEYDYMLDGTQVQIIWNNANDQTSWL